MLGMTLVQMEQGKLALPYLQRSTELLEMMPKPIFNMVMSCTGRFYRRSDYSPLKRQSQLDPDACGCPL